MDGACERRNRVNCVSCCGGSAAPDRGRQRQGAVRRECDAALVSCFPHQADDRLCHFARGEGRPHHARQAAHGVRQRVVASAGEDGLPGRHRADRRQRPQDDDGEVGERHGGRARRRRRRLGRRLRRADESDRPAAGHDADELRQPERSAERRPDRVGARPRHSRARPDPGLAGIRRLLAPARHPHGQERAAQLQHPSRAVCRRRRHEDRLHLRLRLQPGRHRHAQWPAADRGRAGRAVGCRPRAQGGTTARARFQQQQRDVMAGALAGHRRHAAANQRRAAKSARGYVRPPSQASGSRGRGRRDHRQCDAGLALRDVPGEPARPEGEGRGGIAARRQPGRARAGVHRCEATTARNRPARLDRAQGRRQEENRGRQIRQGQVGQGQEGRGKGQQGHERGRFRYHLFQPGTQAEAQEAGCAQAGAGRSRGDHLVSTGHAGTLTRARSGLTLHPAA